MHRITQLRDTTRMELERGTLDKWGKAHDDEKRIVLYLTDVLLTYVPHIHREHTELMTREATIARRAGITTLHDNEGMIMPPMDIP
jgi:hypothetical protein